MVKPFFKEKALAGMIIQVVNFMRVLLAIIRDDLCKVEYRNGAMLLNVVLAYEIKG